MSSRRHVIKTGPNAGRWGKCEADEGACPNKTMHVSATALSAIQAWKSSEAGKKVSQNSLTEKDVLDFAKLEPETQRRFVSNAMFDTVKFRKSSIEGDNGTSGEQERVQYSEGDVNHVAEMDALMDDCLKQFSNGNYFKARTSLQRFTEQAYEAEDKGLAPAGFTKWMISRVKDHPLFKWGVNRAEGSWYMYITGMVGDRIEHSVRNGRPVPSLEELQRWSDDLTSRAKEVMNADMALKDKRKAFKELKAEADPSLNTITGKAKTTMKVIHKFLEDWDIVLPKDIQGVEASMDRNVDDMFRAADSRR